MADKGGSRKGGASAWTSASSTPFDFVAASPTKAPAVLLFDGSLGNGLLGSRAPIFVPSGWAKILKISSRVYHLASGDNLLKEWTENVYETNIHTS